MPILKTIALYFVLVFSVGFVLGIGRVLVLLPVLGERAAELIEMPIMVVVIVLAARWIVTRRLDTRRLSSALIVGFSAMGLVLIADLVVGILLRGMSPIEVFSHRDPISGTAYYMSLLLFACMPVIVVRLRYA